MTETDLAEAYLLNAVWDWGSKFHPRADWVHRGSVTYARKPAYSMLVQEFRAFVRGWK